jgi:hypothetical protein
MIFGKTINFKNMFLLKHCPSSEVGRCSGSKEIPLTLWNLKFHYNVHKIQPQDPILSQMNAVHTLLPYFLKIHFNIVLLFMSTSPNWSVLLLRFSGHNFLCIPLSYIPIHGACPTHCILSDLTT